MSAIANPAKRILAQPVATEWNNDIYPEFLEDCPKLKRLKRDAVVSHAKNFRRWYSGAQIREDWAYSTFHGILSYIQVNQEYIIPNSLIGEENNVANEMEHDPTKVDWSFCYPRGQPVSSGTFIDLKANKWITQFWDALRAAILDGDRGDRATDTSVTPVSLWPVCGLHSHPISNQRPTDWVICSNEC